MKNPEEPLNPLEQTQLSLMEKDVDTLKGTFKGNEHLLKVMRALFFGLKVNTEEKRLIVSTFSDKKLLEAVTKRFYPTLNRDTPIGTVGDILLGAEQMISNVPQHIIQQTIEYKNISLGNTWKAMELLTDPDKHVIDLSYDFNEPDPVGSRLMARNQYIRHIEQQLCFIQVVSEQEVKSVADKKKDLKANSTQ